MSVERINAVIEKLISLGDIPNEGEFNIDDSLVEKYCKVYHELFSKSSGVGKRNKRYAEKLAAISLMKLKRRRINADSVLRKRKYVGKEGFVYFVVNPSFHGFVKVGETKDPEGRLKTYQTYDPMRNFSMEHCVFCTDSRKIEKLVLETYKTDLNLGEWVSESSALELLRFVNLNK